MFKKISLSLLMTISSSMLYADTKPFQLQTRYYATTNLDTQNYQWIIEAQGNTLQNLQYKLINPHPKFSILNEIALQHARNSSLVLEKEFQANQKYHIPYSFSYSPHPIEKKHVAQRNLRHSQRYMVELCEKTRKNPDYPSTMITNQKRQVLIKTNLIIAHTGVIQDVNILNTHELDDTLTQAILKDLKSLALYRPFIIFPKDDYTQPAKLIQGKQSYILHCYK